MDWIFLSNWQLYIVLTLLILVSCLPLIIGLIFMLFGAFFVISGSLGLLRLGDVYNKIHAVGVTDVMGATMMIVGMVFLIPWTIVNIKMLLIILLLWIISPLTAHLLARFVILKKQSDVALDSTPDIYVNSIKKQTNREKR